MIDCALDADGMRAQRERYARAARSVAGIERSPQRLEVVLTEVPHELTEALAIEGECCPFYGIRLDGKRLTVTVDSPELDPALDAIAYALSPSQPSSSSSASGST